MPAEGVHWKPVGIWTAAILVSVCLLIMNTATLSWTASRVVDVGVLTPGIPVDNLNSMTLHALDGRCGLCFRRLCGVSFLLHLRIVLLTPRIQVARVYG